MGSSFRDQTITGGIDRLSARGSGRLPLVALLHNRSEPLPGVRAEAILRAPPGKERGMNIKPECVWCRIRSADRAPGSESSISLTPLLQPLSSTVQPGGFSRNYAPGPIAYQPFPASPAIFVAVCNTSCTLISRMQRKCPSGQLLRPIVVQGRQYSPCRSTIAERVP